MKIIVGIAKAVRHSMAKVERIKFGFYIAEEPPANNFQFSFRLSGHSLTQPYTALPGHFIGAKKDLILAPLLHIPKVYQR